MSDFMIRFLICNVFLDIIIGCLVIFRHLFRNHLTSRAQYHLWFLLPGLMAVPFLPVHSLSFSNIFLWPGSPGTDSAMQSSNFAEKISAMRQPSGMDWMYDLSSSVSRNTPSGIAALLSFLWMAGILAMLLLIFGSALRFYRLKKSSLPVQNPDVLRLYHACLSEMALTKSVPIRNTAFLQSPVLAGLFRPCIYLPLRLVSASQPQALRYMLLHELQHYQHKDTLANHVMTFACIVYWFNPFVWYALKEMKTDREIACDTAVLQMLKQDTYADYGRTLIDFVEKTSLPPFPFATGISGSMRQMKKRILNIAAYRPATFRKNLCSLLLYCTAAALLAGSAPVLAIQAAGGSLYTFTENEQNITYLDLSVDFGDMEGSFVLYDPAADAWLIYDKENARKRISPLSTFKPYSALFALESGVITPRQNLISWNGQEYIRPEWNQDQTLSSAMQSSATWYFQELDRQTTLPVIQNYIRETGYGNQSVSENVSSYWGDSSLKISPIEQVEMLRKLYDNAFSFAPENIETAKQSILLYSHAEGAIYGKTGTAEEDGRNTCGWFIGYVEKDGHPCFFATNVQQKDNATGAAATQLTFSILTKLGVWSGKIG